MNLDSTRYNGIMDWFEGVVQSSLPSYEWFPTPRYFASPQDFAAVAQDTYTKPYNCAYVMMWFGNFRDSLTKGCEEDPNVWLSFNGQIYRTTREARDSAANSHDTLVADIITLRNDFLTTKTIELHSVEHFGLKQKGDLVLARESEFIVNDVGDWMNFSIDVEINNG